MSKLLAAAAAVANGVSMETPGSDGNFSFYWVDESRIIDNPYQYRQIYEPVKLLELAENIRALKTDLPTLGLEQIPYARLVHLVDGNYVPLPREDVATHEQIAHWVAQPGVLAELMFAHRRRRAWTVIRYGVMEGFKRLGLQLPDEFSTTLLVDGDYDYARMPMHIGYADDQQMWRHAVSENRHRSDVTAIEEAEAMATAKNVFKYNDGQIGQIFGYARSTVANKQRLLKLPDGVRKMLLAGQLTERHGRELARLAEYPTEAIEAANDAVEHEQSPDLLERRVTRQLEVIEEKRAERAQVAAAREALKTWCLPGQTAPVGDVDVKTDIRSWDVETFGTNSSADMGLLETGMCGKHCECFCIFHKRHTDAAELHPEPTNAPNIVVGCSSRQRHANQVKRWQKQHAPTAKVTAKERERIDAELKRAQLKADREQAGNALIDETLAATNLRSLWNSVEFWKVISAQNMPEQFTKRLAKAKSINDVAETYLRWFCDCRGREWDRDAGGSVYDVGKLRKLFQQLGGVSTETEEAA